MALSRDVPKNQKQGFSPWTQRHCHLQKPAEQISAMAMVQHNEVTWSSRDSYWHGPPLAKLLSCGECSCILNSGNLRILEPHCLIIKYNLSWSPFLCLTDDPYSIELGRALSFTSWETRASVAFLSLGLVGVEPPTPKVFCNYKDNTC